MTVKHPAKYSAAIMPLLDSSCIPDGSLVLDPMCGTGRIHQLRPRLQTVGVELEPEWASMSTGTIRGNALHLPFQDSIFDAVIVSPVYGNRMSDSHEAKERCRTCRGTGQVLVLTSNEDCPKCGGAGFRKYTRNTYRHTLGRKLHPDNAGQLQWGEAYRTFHVAAWREAARVLTQASVFVLNISDHYRNFELQKVTLWHKLCLECLGFMLIDTQRVATPRNRQGANSTSRPEYESVLTFIRLERV